MVHVSYHSKNRSSAMCASVADWVCKVIHIFRKWELCSVRWQFLKFCYQCVSFFQLCSFCSFFLLLFYLYFVFFSLYHFVCVCVCVCVWFLLFDTISFNSVELHCHIIRFVFANEDLLWEHTYETNVIWGSDPFKINKMNVRYTIQVCIPSSVSVSLVDLSLYYKFY
jgi:hypothetical protein